MGWYRCLPASLFTFPAFCGQPKGLVINPILRGKEGGRREERGGKGGRDRREDGVAAGRGEAEGGRREEEEGKTDKG